MYASPPTPPPATAPGQQVPAESSAQSGNWHRYHYPIGIFLTLYGLTGLLGVLIGWNDHRTEIAAYLTKTAGLDTGLATAVLVGLHVIETLLILTALAGLLRRRDVWFLPVILGWMAGFAVFCVLDVWAATFTLLAEHGVYLVGFTVLLLVSYALGVKARVGRMPPGLQPNRPEQPKLTRTQEIALAALQRWRPGAPPAGVPSPRSAQSAPGPAGSPPPLPAPAATPTAGSPAPAGPGPAPATLPATAPDLATPSAPAPNAAPAPAPTPALAPAPTPAPAPAPAQSGQKPAPLPPPRRFPVTPPEEPPSS